MRRTASNPGIDSRGYIPGMGEHKILGIDHVGIAVANLDEAIAWYEQAFGLVATHTEVNEEQGVREAMLSAGDGGTAIQLLAPLRPDSTIGKFLDRNGPGIQQMAYRVVDIEATSAALRAQGKRLLYAEPRNGTAGSRVNFVHPKDAGGVLVELVEPAATSH
jgi:methylmalonyl-CoA/ethylmalonyl-CoA epimerase